MMRHFTWIPVTLVTFAAVAAAQDAGRPLAIHAKRALTVSGAPIDDAVILVEGGRIKAVGTRADVDVPEEADIIETACATPGFVHPAALAMGPSGNYDVSGRTNAADKSIAEDLNPAWPGVKTLAEAGYTSVNVIAAGGGITGQSVLIRPVPRLKRPIRPDDVIVHKDVALCMAFEPRTSNKNVWREVLGKVKAYREARAAAESRPATASESAPASRPESAPASRPDSAPASRPGGPAQDPKVMPLVDLFDGKMPGVLLLGNAAALLHFLPIMEEHSDFKPALMLGDDSWRMVDRVKKLGVPVVLSPRRTFRPDTIIELVPVRDFVAAGVTVALIPETNFAQKYEGLPFHLAELSRKGVAADVLIRAVTLTPAEILGIQKDVGSLEAGKAADILLWSGDPLSPQSRLDRVIAAGVTVHDAKESP